MVHFSVRLLRHIIINAVVISLLAGCGYVMFLLINDDKDHVKELRKKYIIGDLVTPITVTAMIFFIPKIFSLMTLVERYELPQRKLYMTLFR